MQFYLTPLEGSVPLKMRAAPQTLEVEGAGDNRGFSSNYLLSGQEKIMKRLKGFVLLRSLDT